MAELFGLPEALNLIMETRDRKERRDSPYAHISEGEWKNMSQLSGRHRIMVAARGTLGMTVLKRVERILDEHGIFHHQLSGSRRSDWRLLVVVLLLETLNPWSLSRTMNLFEMPSLAPALMIRESAHRRRTSQASHHHT